MQLMRQISQEERLREVLRNEDVKFLAKFLFNVELSKMQEVIVRSIAFPDSKRIVISCMTRYGKSFCVSMGILMFAMFQRNKRILLIAPIVDRGILIKSVERGLIDFPSLMDGNLIYLCWQAGEPELMYWHTVDSGFAGRQSL